MCPVARSADGGEVVGEDEEEGMGLEVLGEGGDEGPGHVDRQGWMIVRWTCRFNVSQIFFNM
jgi:hypothetical protein